MGLVQMTPCPGILVLKKEACMAHQYVNKIMNVPCNISENAISTVPTGIFSQLYQLKKLKLDYNQLTVFPNLDGVDDTLEELHLFNNDISYINPVYLTRLTKLTILMLNENPVLDFFPDVPGPSFTLTTLSFQNCGFTELPMLTNIPNVKTLSFGKLKQLLYALFRVRNLTLLSIHQFY